MVQENTEASYVEVNKMTNEDVSTAVDKLVDWENPPSLSAMKTDLEGAQGAHQLQVQKVQNWLKVLAGNQTIKARPGRSKIVPKVARKQAEWRYAALSEPFLSTDDLFNTEPATFEDRQAAEQNGLVLNYQFTCKIDRTAFIDEYIRTAVDEGTVVVRVGWEEEEGKRTFYEDQFETRNLVDPATGQIVQQQVKVGIKESIRTVKVKNQPTVEVMDYNNVVIDPTCNGDLDKAEFIITSFETSYAELKKDGRYKNLDHVTFDSNSVLNAADHNVQDKTAFTFKDKPRMKVVAREYWGYWDIDGDGEVEAFVATWIGDTLVRLEENPFPDKKPPFVLVQYLPKRKNIYGEPDAELIEDNQKIIGAVTRGVIDIMGRSANGQQGIRKDALDVANARKFERGEDYKFNSNVDPKQAFQMSTYPEIPRSALEVITLQSNEAEALTGVKSFSQGISGQALGSTATGVRSALDATAKRELGILRRLSNGILKIGRKIIAMNSENLEDEEIIRVTNEQFVAINRNDLSGNYDVKLNISTAEADEQKASELSFMLQTMGNNMPAEMSSMILAEIAKLRKMPDLAKRIQDYQPQPDPFVEQERALQLQLLRAQIANEEAKAQENTVDVDLKQAKTQTERAKARNLHSKSDNDDLTFVERESGVDHARSQQDAADTHAREMEKKDHDRLANLDIKGFDALNASEQPITPTQPT